jgi:hypothetical protein
VRFLTLWVTCRRLSARFSRLPLWLFFIFGRWIFADCGAPSTLRNRRLTLSFIRDDIQPAGNYLLDTDEELIEDLSRLAYQGVASSINASMRTSIKLRFSAS